MSDTVYLLITAIKRDTPELGQKVANWVLRDRYNHR